MGFRFDTTPDRAKDFDQLVLARARSGGRIVDAMAHVRSAVKAGAATDRILAASKVTDWRELYDVTLDPARREQMEVTKASVAAGDLSDSTWAAPLAALSTLQSAWFASLRNQSMLDALVQGGMLPVPPGRKLGITAASGSGVTVDDAAWTPLTKFSFDGATTASLKALGLVVVSNDLLRFGDVLAENAITTQLRAVVSTAADVSVIGALVDGLSAIASTGDARQDLRNAFAAIAIGQGSRPVIFAAPTLTKQMALAGHGAGPEFPDLQIGGGGSIGGAPCLPIDALTDYSSHGDVLMVVDAAQLAGSAGGIDITASNSGSVQMTDDASGAASLVSLFETSSTALRATRWFNIERIRSAAVAFVDHCAYGSGGSPA